MGQRNPFPPGDDRRRYPRVPLDTSVGYRPNGDARPGRALNLSAGGLAFRPAEPLDPDTIVVVEFSLPPESDPIEVTGRVRWQQAAEEPACGIEFTDMTDEARQQILAYIERLLRAAAEVSDTIQWEEE